MMISGYEIRLQGLPLPLIILLAAVAAYSVFRYHRFLLDVAFPMPWPPLALRSVALALLLLLAAGPAFLYRREVPETRNLAVIADTSQSVWMDYGDGVTSRRTVTGALDVIKNSWQRTPRLFSFDEELVERSSIEEIEAIEPGGRATRLYEAIENLPRSGGDPVSDIIVITDGNDTSGMAPSSPSGARVHVLGVGRAGGANAGLYNLEVPEYGFVESPVTVSGDIYTSGFPAGTTVGIELFEDGIRAGQETITAGGRPGARSRFSISYEPAAPGYRALELRIKTGTDDSFQPDNSRTAFIDIISARRSVLYVDAPNYEFRFLKEYLSNIEKLSVDIVTAGPGGKTFEGAGLRETLSDSRALGKYRVVIIGRAAGFLDSAEAEALLDYADGGGQIISLGGRNSVSCSDNALGRAAGFTSSSPSGDRTGFEVTPTNEGMKSGLLRLAPSAEENRQVWKTLPMVETICRTRPGTEAVVLATHPWMKCEEQLCPAIFTTGIGRGRALVFTYEGLWRWRFRRREHRRYASLWDNILDDMLETRKQEPVQLSLREDTIVLGDTISAAVKLGPGVAADNPAAPVLSVRGSGGGNEQEIPMTPAGDLDQLFYNADFQPQKTGLYEIAATAGGVKSDSLRFFVYPSPQEFVSVAQNVDANRRLVDMNDGYYFPAEQAGDLVERLGESISYSTEQHRFAPWSSPFIMGLIILLLTAEWIFRRRGGLT